MPSVDMPQQHTQQLTPPPLPMEPYPDELQETGERVGLRPRALPGLPALRSAKPMPVAHQERRIGFNCPACLAILVIKQPESYDGTAAPCPNCQSIILPPRVVPSSPFTLASQPKSPALDELEASITVTTRSPDRLTDQLAERYRGYSTDVSADPQDPSEPVVLTPRHIARTAMLHM
jgi:hypothetical protein